MPVLREMVPHGVMVIVHGATISVWHQEQVINLLIFTLTEAGLTTLNMQHQKCDQSISLAAACRFYYFGDL